VDGVVEAEVGRGNDQTRDLLPVARSVTHMAIAALADEIGAGLDLARAVIGPVATVAARPARQQGVRAALAGLGSLVARGAGRAEADVAPVIEAHAERLRGVDDVARTAVPR
jgi:hypothetical protein